MPCRLKNTVKAPVSIFSSLRLCLPYYLIQRQGNQEQAHVVESNLSSGMHLMSEGMHPDSKIKLWMVRGIQQQQVPSRAGFP